ncbi:MAG: DNA-directed RNA polymerase subunit beta', partial [Oscillospiraceae bacterium]|nr:DNA-directed RNA polymerase subunit beta' [Oscillospiraceae bacterium]
PFIMKKLVEDGSANNIKSAKKMVDKGKTEVWDALDVVIKEHPVLLNRAPTLHRLGIQAFEPILVEGRALRLHPLVCTAFNADFDGDQMAIHVPLSAEAQAEARILMLSANNLLHPRDGLPVTIPTQDMILGSYYLTYIRMGKAEKGAEQIFVTDPGDTDLPANSFVDGELVSAANNAAEKAKKTPASYKGTHSFSSVDEAIMAYQSGDIGMHAPINVRMTREFDGVMASGIITTTVGRIIFNNPIPQDLEFIDRTDPNHRFDLEISFRVGKKELGKIIDRCIEKHGFAISVEMLDNVKAQGYKYSTISGITINVSDMTVPEEKRKLIGETEKKVVNIENMFRRGLITNDERYRLVVHEWEKTTQDVTNALQSSLDEFNPIFMMANSGARGSMAQIRQLSGMRGLMANTSGKTIEIPVKSNFREGLTVLEYFTSARGARKGLADTALRTADSGYLTRRMVDVSQDVIIREIDCGTHDGIWAQEKIENNQVVDPFKNAIHGRYPAEDIVDPATGEVLFTRDDMLVHESAKVLEAHGINKVKVRSVLTCEAKSGVCSHCYGMNLATGITVNAGEAVGVIAAQSIGEPGTQLTMRTFHTGGVAGGEAGVEITQGLPRVEELFEARKPKKAAVISEISGTVSMEEVHKGAMIAITIKNPDDGEIRTYAVAHNSGIKVKDGDTVKQGDILTGGALNPHDILRISGRDALQQYLIDEVKRVYRQQGIDISDKHIEVIVRQMMRKVRVEDAGDTDLLSGSLADVLEVRAEEEKLRAREEAGETDLVHPTYTHILMGITKASLATDSFLSAASFQETTKVLTEAATKGKIDKLVGLKENVIIGKLIPAGSGLDMYHPDDDEPEEKTAETAEVPVEEEEPQEPDLDLSGLKGNAI